MIAFENIDITGWMPAIRGMRNPMNSWDKSDSFFICDDESDAMTILGDTRPYTYSDFIDAVGVGDGVFIGKNDAELMKKLAMAGTDHAKFRRMIIVYMDITAPLYWWKEFDTYKVGTVANSCSTMHKIAEKEFTLEDFSCEHLFSVESGEDDDRVHKNTIWLDDIFEVEDSMMDEIITMNGITPVATSIELLSGIVTYLNTCRENFLETHDKKYWWQMIQLLPSSYNQKRTVMVNYEVLANIYKSRKNHKLDEWVGFCKLLITFPYSELITMEYKEEEE